MDANDQKPFRIVPYSDSSSEEEISGDNKHDDGCTTEKLTDEDRPGASTPFSQKDSGHIAPPALNSSERCICRRKGCKSHFCDCLRAGRNCSLSCACRSECDYALERKQEMESPFPNAVHRKIKILGTVSPAGMVATTSVSQFGKGCNCKRSKCLKLYCECFASGLYCLQSCGCQGCLNMSKNEVIVLDSKKKIESRDPLAFASKVVKTGSDSPAHIRGCNCMKSRCLNKYCECLQMRVGCTVGCRCEGCKNSFGAKKAYVHLEWNSNKAGIRTDSFSSTLSDSYPRRTQQQENNYFQSSISTLGRSILSISHMPQTHGPRMRNDDTSEIFKDTGKVMKVAEVSSETSSTRRISRCYCKKTMCVDNYCNCYKMGVACSACGCIGCKNVKGSQEG